MKLVAEQRDDQSRQEYPSNLKLGLIFCANSDKPDSKWYGYDVADRIGEIGAAFWQTAPMPGPDGGEGVGTVKAATRGAARRTKSKTAKKAKTGRKPVAKGKGKGKAMGEGAGKGTGAAKRGGK